MNKNNDKLKKVVITIGVLSVLSGIYFILQGGTFMESYWSVFLGAVLIGSAYTIKQKEEKSNK